MEIFKQSEIKIPFSEAITQMSVYIKCLKDFLSKKRKYIEEDIIEVQGFQTTEKLFQFLFSTTNEGSSYLVKP